MADKVTGIVGAKAPGMGQRLSASDWVQLLSAFGPAALSAVGGAGQASYDRKRQEQLDAIERAREEYNRRMGARAGLSSFYANQLETQRLGSQALANAMPLGAEQDLALRMGAMRGLSAAGAAGPQAEASTNPVLQARLAAQPAQNFFAGWARPDVVQAISPEATARSIAERRKALAGLDPNFQFGSMGDYGVPDLGGEVSGYAGQVRNQRAQTENTLLQYLQQQMNEATQPLVPPTTAPTTGTAAGSQKTPWWKRALKVAATAAPIIAAPFTGGTSLALIGAGAGALAGGLDGGMKGALTGGALGAATAGLGGGAGGAAAKRAVGESAKSAIQRAVLNPQALARLTGAGIGGSTGQAIQTAGMFLPGPKAYAGGTPTAPSTAAMGGLQRGTSGLFGPTQSAVPTMPWETAGALPEAPLAATANQTFLPSAAPVTPALSRAATASYGQGRMAPPSGPTPWTPGTSVDEAFSKATGISAPPTAAAPTRLTERMKAGGQGALDFMRQYPGLVGSPLGGAVTPFVAADAALGTGVMDRLNKGLGQLGDLEFMQTLRQQPFLRAMQTPMGQLMAGGILGAGMGAGTAAVEGAEAAGMGRLLGPGPSPRGLLPSGPPPVVPRPGLLPQGPSPAGLLRSGPPPIAAPSRLLGPGAPGGALARTPGTALGRPTPPNLNMPPSALQQVQNQYLEIQTILRDPKIPQAMKQQFLTNPTVQQILQQYQQILNWM